MTVALGGAKQRALLALLVMRANEVVSADRLIDALWDGRPPDSALNLVHGYVSHLRKALDPEHEVLVSQPPGYVLQVAGEQIDAERFAALAAAARRALDEGDAASARSRLGEALGLWRGPAYADLADETFARAEAERLDEARLAALEDHVDAALALGHGSDVVAELRELVAAHPLRERLHAQLMIALYAAGRQAEALETYRDARRILHSELGIEPGPALRAVERAILQQDPALPGPRIPRRRRGRRRLGLVVALVAVASVASAAVALTRRPARHAPVVVYPHSVAVIDPATNTIAADVLVGAYPGPLAVDGGWIYVCNIGDASLSRIAPKRLAAINDGSFARAVDLVVRHGDIWAADGGTPGYTPLGVGPGTLLHYSPGPRWQTVRVGPPTYNAPEDDTTIAADGRSDVVWAGNEDTRTLTELDAAGGTKLLTIHGIAPGGLAVIRRGDADTVWATDARAGTVVRIDEAAKRVTARVRIGGRPTRIAADGRDLWIVVPAPRRLLVRIDQVTGRVVARIPLPVIPMRVAIGVGAVWVSGYRWSNGVDAAHGGAVLRIDPASDRIVAHIPLGDVAADGVIVADGRVWVAVPPSA